MDSERELIDLAAAVADGRPDWAAPAARAGDQRAQGVIDHLRTIADIARLHQQADQSGSDRSGAVMLKDEAQILSGPWGPLEIISPIGAGRFGDVYRAFDPNLAREVALKIVRQPQLEGQKVIEEGRLAARIRHPNVITIYGAQRVGGRAGLWMELIEGRTLEDELSERGPFSAEELVEAGIALCGALAAVHAAGCVHRDVKTTNVMREASGRLVLGDFGTGHALVEDDQVRRGFAGTPAYLAPEVFDRQQATPRSDVYSLGVLLYRLATGAYPVPGQSIPEIRAAHGAGARTAVRTLRPELPARLSAAIERASHPDPGLRFQSAAAMGVALARRSAPRPLAVVGASALGGAALVAMAVSSGLFSGRDLIGDRRGIGVEQLDAGLQQRALMLGSAVGDVIPCLSREEARTGVAICDLANATVTLLRQGAHPGVSAGGVLTPDGHQLIYVWRVEADGQRKNEVRIIDRNGSHDRLLHASSDVVKLHKWHAATRAVYMTEGSGARLLPLDGGPPTLVAEFDEVNQMHDLSPDGQRLALTQSAAPGRQRDLVVLDVQTQKLQWRLSDASDDFLPTWTPDGRAVVFASTRVGGNSLMIMRKADTATPDPPEMIWSLGRTTVRAPAGFGSDRAFYFTAVGPQRTVFVADVDLDRRQAGTPRIVDPQTMDDTFGADWSPDGDRLAYLRARLSGPGDGYLVIRRTDGTLLHEFAIDGRLTQINSHVRWSPDARRIAVLHGLVRQRVLDLFDSDTGKSIRILEGAEFWDPRFASSGTVIHFVRKTLGRDETVVDAEIQSITLDGVRRVNAEYRPTDDGVILGFDRSASGHVLLRLKKPGTPRCRLRTVRPDGAMRDFAFSEPVCPWAGWTDDGRWMLVSVKPPDELGVVWLVDTETDERHRLPLRGDLMFSHALNRARNALLGTAGNPPPLTWKLTGLLKR